MGDKNGLKHVEIWAQKVTQGYKGVEIQDLSTSWKDGLAFCALIHHFRPDLIKFDVLSKKNVLKNNRLAFKVAEENLGIPPLLNPEDMVKTEDPKEKDIVMYLSQFYEKFQGFKSKSLTNQKSEVFEPRDESNDVQQEDEDEVTGLLSISALYTQIGFKRKAAFYKRFAALKSVSLSLKNQDWLRCYQLLLEALNDYDLTLDPLEYDKRVKEGPLGWAGVHIQILQEVVTAARRLTLDQLAIRHLSFLLHVFFEHLSVKQRKDLAAQLENLSRESGEGAPVPLKLDNGTVIPSVNLTKFPYVVSFNVQNLAPHLRPHVLKRAGHHLVEETSPNSPFIFTPLNLNRPLTNVKPVVHDTRILDFKWVQNEVGEVHLQVYNYFPVDLSVRHMQLMTDGVPFEVCPVSITLEPNAGPFAICATGIPRGVGSLEILGYDTHVLGVKSSCLLRDLPYAKKMNSPMNYSIEIVPPLPLLSVSCPYLDKSSIVSSLSSDIEYISANYPVSLNAGEKKSVTIFLCNSSSNSDESIQMIHVRIFSRLKKREETQLLSFSCDINDHLPLAHGASCEFSLDFYGFSDFVAEDKKRPIIRRRKSGTSTPLFATQQNSGMSSPSHSKKQSTQLTSALTNFLSSMKNSSSSSVNQLKSRHARTHSVDRNEASLEPVYPSRMLDVIVEFEYSGGSGLKAGFCRKCAINFNVEIKPSVLLTHWHVLPAESAEKCFLVLDVLNASSDEMELKYATNKSILIESKETCRIPVQIERCILKNEETGDTLSPTSLSSKCKSHLVSQVKLEYQLMGSSESSGRVSIESVPWNHFVLETILMSPVQWEVSVNGNLLPSDKPEVNCSIGELVPFNIILSNHSDHPLKYLCLWINVYQDNINGTKNYKMDSKRTTHGKDKINIEKVVPKDSFKHELSYIFLYSGQYKMDIICSGFDENLMGLVSGQSVEISANCYKYQEQQLRAEILMSSSKSSSSTSSSSSFMTSHHPNQTGMSSGPSIWRCTPPLEINVSV